MTDPTRRTPAWRKALKVFLWTVMAVVLFVGAILMVVLNMLTAPRLTRLTESAANRMLDADVSIGRVELSLMSHLPFLRLEIDSLTVLSRPVMRLDAASRGRLPEWADTLLTIDHFGGGINISALLANRIELHDVVFDRPGINIATLNDSISNYLVYPTSEESDTTSATSIPQISINHFRIDNARPLRYHNAQTDEHFTVQLDRLSIDGGNTPVYSLSMGGNFDNPSLELYNLGHIPIGLGGRIGWTPQSPTELALSDFRLVADFLDATVNAHVDFGRDIIVRDYSLELGEMGIERILRVVPDSLKRAYKLDPTQFATDLAISFSARSTAPFNLTTDSLPHAVMTLSLTPGPLRYRNMRLNELGGKFTADLRGNDLNAAVFTVEDLKVQGPATDLLINGTVSQAGADPLFRGSLRGHTDLRRLPPELADLMRGFISGHLSTDITFEGRPSMFSRDTFHKLKVSGELTGRDLFYLSNDTVNMVSVHKAAFEFGTNSRFTAGEHMVDSLLTASIKVDSAEILHSNISMRVNDLALGIGASNRKATADTTAIIPMGGHMDLGSFYLTVLNDTVVFNLRGASGRVAMRRFKGDGHLPQFDCDLYIRRISTGSSDSRFMMSGASLKATAHKLPGRKVPEPIRHTADSLRQVHPDLPIDSVYRYAILKHRKTGHHLPRVHPQYTDLESEIINWGTSKSARRLLLGWDIRGSLSADRAALFTPCFPVRNRVRNFNVTFTNDSVNLENIKYKAGNSDFLMSGRITNIKRGFTSKGFRSPLKAHFEILSDTIDVNELASASFRGSAYMASLADTVRADDNPSRRHFDIEELEKNEELSDEEFERSLGRIVADAPDSMAPLLIPRNVDVEIQAKAHNVLYSDLKFHDFSGELLAYQGALNLHHLAARSDVGAINLSALYSAPAADEIKFGFGLQVNDFNIDQFTKLVPAVDSLMPILHDFKGIIDADLAATCDLDRSMNFDLPTLTAAIRLQGDSLVLIDAKTYKTIGKWLLFKDKQDNVIDHMNVEMTIRDNQLRIFPFMFDIDRYKLGVQGYNDLAMNFNYHIAVLKSPLPFKFGVNISGNPDDFKVRLGKARFNEKSDAVAVSLVDTARVNLLRQIENIFRRGVSNSRFANLNISNTPSAAEIDLDTDTISHADSLEFIRQGLIPAPEEPPVEQPARKKKSGKTKKSKDSAYRPGEAVMPRRQGFFNT